MDHPGKTTTKRLLRVLAGEAIFPPPLWLMRQAGRYLPEYRATRARAGSFLSLATTPELAAEVTLQPLRRFALDAAILFSDILIVPWGLGQGLDYREGEGPALPPIRDVAGLRGLEMSRLAGSVAPILETIRIVRGDLGEAALIGFAGGPFTVACYMVEGGGSREFAHTRALAYADPPLFAALLDIVTEATIAYLRGQIDAGAETVMLFDSWAGILPPTQFRRHVIEPTRRIVAALERSHPAIRVIGFPRLAGPLIAEYATSTGVNALAIDTGMDPVVAMQLVPPGIALQGNLDPLLLVAGGNALVEEAQAIARALRGRPHIFNLGHGIVPQTPPAHIAQLVDALRRA